MSRKTTVIWLCIILLVGIGIRSYQLTARSLWFDEAFSWRLIQFPWTELIARDAQDVHPPLYYVLLKSWAWLFGSTALSLRAFSVAAAVVAIWGIYHFTYVAFGSRRAGLLAAWLGAIAGFQIQSAWEARMYTLGTALIVWSAWFLLKALYSRTARLGWWVGFGLVTVAAAYTHYYLLFSIIAEAILLVAYFFISTRGRIGEILQWRQWWYAVIAGLLIAGLYAPWLPVLRQQGAAVQQSFWIPAFSWWGLSDAFYHFFIPTLSGPSHTGLLGIAWAMTPLVLSIGICLLVLLTARPSQRVAAWLIILLSMMPFVCSIGVSLLGRSIFQERYLLFSQLFLLIALAGFWDRLPWRSWRITVVLILSAGLLLADWQYWQALDVTHKPGAQAATRAVFMAKQPNEPVIVNSSFIYFSILHYAAEEFPQQPTPTLYSDTGELAHFAGGPILQTSDIVGANIFSTTSAHRIWVVDTTGFGGSPLAVPAPWQRGDSQSYPEVHDYQGKIIITPYTR